MKNRIKLHVEGRGTSQFSVFIRSKVKEFRVNFAQAKRPRVYESRERTLHGKRIRHTDSRYPTIVRTALSKLYKINLPA